MLWPVESGHNDLQMTIALIYYPAILIFLSGIFDYHLHWQGICFPQVSPKEVQEHVDDILFRSRASLRHTNLAGILLFFPLRVAGARSTSAEQKLSILAMLADISCRSFIVADTFSEDLKALWSSDKIEDNRQ